MYKSRLELYKKLLHFFKDLRTDPCIKSEYRTYLAHVLFFDIKNLLKKEHNQLLDMGGATGEFCKVLENAYGFNCVNLDPNLYVKKLCFSPSISAAGQNLPFKNKTFDIIICRGVLEHVSDIFREKIMKEIYRTLKNDGLARIVIPPWFNPFAGHSLKPFHVLPFRFAVYLATNVFWLHRSTSKINPKSLEDLELYPITFRQMSKLIKRCGFKIICCHDVLLRNHFLTSIPVIREFSVPSVAFNIRKKQTHYARTRETNLGLNVNSLLRTSMSMLI